MGRRHVSAKRQQNGHQDEVDVAGNTPIKKTAFPAISHSRSRSEPAIQHSDLEITASEVDSDDSSEDEGLYKRVFHFIVLLQNKGQKNSARLNHPEKKKGGGLYGLCLQKSLTRAFAFLKENRTNSALAANYYLL